MQGQGIVIPAHNFNLFQTWKINQIADRRLHNLNQILQKNS
jgi:hypothetical protein